MRPERPRRPRKVESAGPRRARVAPHPGFPSRRSRTGHAGIVRSGSTSIPPPGIGGNRLPSHRVPRGGDVRQSPIPVAPGSRVRGRHPRARSRDARTPVPARGPLRPSRRDRRRMPRRWRARRRRNRRRRWRRRRWRRRWRRNTRMTRRHATHGPTLAPPPDESVARVGSPAPRGIVVVRDVVRGRGRVRRRRTQRGVGSVDARDQTSQGWRGRGRGVGLSRAAAAATTPRRLPRPRDPARVFVTSRGNTIVSSTWLFNRCGTFPRSTGRCRRFARSPASRARTRPSRRRFGRYLRRSTPPPPCGRAAQRVGFGWGRREVLVDRRRRLPGRRRLRELVGAANGNANGHGNGERSRRRRGGAHRASKGAGGAAGRRFALLRARDGGRVRGAASHLSRTMHRACASRRRSSPPDALRSERPRRRCGVR